MARLFREIRFRQLRAPIAGVLCEFGPEANSIAIMLRLEWTILADANIAGLFIREFGYVGTNSIEVQPGNFLIKMLWQHVNLVLVVVAVLPEFDLSENLVGERV